MAPDLVVAPLFCGATRAVFCNVQPALHPKPFIDSAGGFPMRYPTLIMSVICMVVAAGSASAEKRVAFVVGNGAYKNVAPLPNPSVDAKAMAATLRNVGFEVVEGTNLTRDKMNDRL